MTTPQKTHGLTGVTLGAIIQSASTVVIGVAARYRLRMEGRSRRSRLYASRHLRRFRLSPRCRLERPEDQEGSRRVCIAGLRGFGLH